VGLEAQPRTGGALDLTWAPALERGVVRYRVRYENAAGQTVEREAPAASRPSLRLENVRAGSTVSVKAVNDRGLEGWDWAHLPLAR
jgi:hypothetical protein